MSPCQMTHSRPALGLLVGSVLAVSAPAAADAAGHTLKTARFHAIVTGTQTTDWKQDTTRYDGCIDGSTRTTGAGTERMTFKSTRRAPVEVLEVDGEAVLSPGVRGLPVRGAVTRRGELRHEQLSGGESGCGGVPEGAQPEQPPAPDCGTRPWRGAVSPIVVAPEDYPAPDRVVPRVPVVNLSGPELPGATAIGDLFRNCVGGDGSLAPTPDSALPRRRVFSRAKRVVIRGGDRVTESIDGYTKTVTIRWRMDLVRRGTGAEDRRAPQCANGRDDDGDGRVDFPRDAQCRSPRDRSER